MITRLLASILGADFASLNRGEKRIRLRNVTLMGSFIASMVIVAISGYTLGLQMGPPIKITEDHGRNFGGIIATVIPIFVVALYVDSSPQWGANQHDNALARKEMDPSKLKESEKDFVSPFQLLFCLFGETFALSSVLTPTTTQIRLATYSLAFLLFLFGYRLNVGGLKRLGPESSKVSSYFGGITFLLFMFIFSFYLAGISRILVL